MGKIDKTDSLDDMLNDFFRRVGKPKKPARRKNAYHRAKTDDTRRRHKYGNG